MKSNTYEDRKHNETLVAEAQKRFIDRYTQDIVVLADEKACTCGVCRKRVRPHEQGYSWIKMNQVCVDCWNARVAEEMEMALLEPPEHIFRGGV